MIKINLQVLNRNILSKKTIKCLSTLTMRDDFDIDSLNENHNENLNIISISIE